MLYYDSCALLPQNREPSSQIYTCTAVEPQVTGKHRHNTVELPRYGVQNDIVYSRRVCNTAFTKTRSSVLNLHAHYGGDLLCTASRSLSSHIGIHLLIVMEVLIVISLCPLS